jgi:hypothetical protein
MESTATRFGTCSIAGAFGNPLKDIYDELADKLRSYDELLDQADACVDDLDEAWELSRGIGREIDRQRFATAMQYAWSIPTQTAIDMIVACGPIVEIGAGTGYWARMISEAGGDVVAYDAAPPETVDNRFCNQIQYFDVVPGGPETAALFPERALLLCWPPYRESFADECLQAYLGDTVIFIGELEGGCCASDAFWLRLDDEFDKVGDVVAPQWPGVHDEVVVYRRK